MNIKAKFEELTRAKQMLESDEFQKYIMQPVFEEMDKLKNAYDCESLRELSTVKGKKQGLKFIIGLSKQINSDRENTHYEIEQSDK